MTVTKDTDIRVRMPQEQSYRLVRLVESFGDGWWSAWLDRHGYLWSHLGIVHESWQRGKLGGERVEQWHIRD